jgi:hypothetical protein
MRVNKNRAHAVSTDLTVLDPKPGDVPVSGVEQAVVEAEAPVVEAEAPVAPTVLTVQQSTKPESIRSFSERAIRSGIGYQEVLDQVLKNFPKASTTISCIRWYAAQMRKAGEVVEPRPKTGRPREKFLLSRDEMDLIAAKFDGENSVEINSLLDKLRELAPPTLVEETPVSEAA